MDSVPLGVTYYPACIVNLLIRFDESFHKAANESVVQQVAAKAASPSNNQVLTDLPNGGDLFTTQATEPGSYITGRIPLRGAIELNNIRKPGTFNLTFDYRDLPIDPRIVRSVGIEIYLDTVSANNFANIMRNVMVTPQKAPALAGMTGFVPFAASPKNLVLKGVVDNWSVQHTSSGSTATLEGRDLVGVFLNTPVTPTMLQQLNATDKTIIDLVREFVGTVKAWADKLDVDGPQPARWPGGQIPVIAVSDKRLNPGTLLYETNAGTEAVVTASGKTPHKKKDKKPRGRSTAEGTQARISPGAHQDKLNLWDLITRYCNLAAAVPTFTVKRENGGPYKACLYIQPQWGLYDYFSTNSEGPGSPFKPPRNTGVGASAGDPDNVRHLQYGWNIEELNLERKYQGITARAVEAVSYNPSASSAEDRMISAISGLPSQSYAAQAGVSPPIAEASRVPVSPGVVPSGLTSQDEVLRIEVRGVTSIDDLQKIADGLFEEIMRGETTGTVRTRSLASFGGNNEDPDLLRIRPRDPLRLSMNNRPMPAHVAGFENGTSGTPAPQTDAAALAAQLAESFGNDTNLANAIAYSATNQVAELQNLFRVNSVSFDWDVNAGIGLTIDFHNYVVARNSRLPGATSGATSGAAVAAPAAAPAAPSATTATAVKRAAPKPQRHSVASPKPKVTRPARRR